MDKKITAKVNMFTQVENKLEENADIVNSSPAFIVAKTHLNTRLDFVESLMRGISLKNTGAAKDKKNAREHLCEWLETVGSGIYAFAQKNNNLTLAQKVSAPYSTYLRMRGTELQEAAQAIYDLADLHKAGIADYNVGPDDLTKLAAAIQKFKTDNSKPRGLIIDGKSTRSILKKAVKDLNDFIKEEMDKIAITYKSKNPEFYTHYFNARRNYSEGIRHRKPAIEDAALNQKMAENVPGLADEAAGFLEKAVQEMATQVAETNGVTAG